MFKPTKKSPGTSAALAGYICWEEAPLSCSTFAPNHCEALLASSMPL